MNCKDLLPYLKDPWAISWVVSGLLAIFIPLITWSVNKSKYYNAYGYAQEAEDYYEQQQQYYEQQQQYYEQQQNGDDYAAEVSYYKDCSWFNWSCRKKQWEYATYDENGGNDNDEDEEVLPGWFYFLGGESEEMQRWKEDNTGVRTSSSEGGLKFVYALTLILAFTLLGYGAFVIGKKQSVTNLIVLLGLTATIGLMNLIMNVGGVISADEKDFEDSYDGWYGQMGVLLVYTNFWMILFSLVFGGVFLVKAHFDKKNEGKGDKIEETEAGVYYGDV